MLEAVEGGRKATESIGEERDSGGKGKKAEISQKTKKKKRGEHHGSSSMLHLRTAEKS